MGEEYFNIKSNPKGDTITPKSIYKELSKNERGKSWLNYIKENNIDVDISYNEPKDKNVIGRAFPDLNKIVIYASRTKSAAVTARVIVHELKHMEINMPNSKWQEKLCYIEEKLFEKGTDTLTDDELLSIIIHIDKEYPWLPEE